MEIVKYLEDKKKLHSILLEYIEEIEFTIKLQDNSKLICQLGNPNEINKSELKEILLCISFLSNNHHRYPNFLAKIEEILVYFKPAIQRILTNYEIFNIFDTNKRILLFLFENDFIKPDEQIAQIITKNKFKQFKYPEYFYPEFKPFFDVELKTEIEKEVEIIEENMLISFNEKRKIGENDNYICELIRQDSIDDFIILINKPGSHFINIIPSIFETNPYILSNGASLIDYAAFFGSTQIFNHLFFLNHQLSPNSLVYCVHGNNPTLFHSIEEKFESKKELALQSALVESIKSHHNDYVEFICDSLSIKITDNINNVSQCIKSFNFNLFPDDLSSSYNFYFLCQYDHFPFVDILLKTTRFDVNEIVIS